MPTLIQTDATKARSQLPGWMGLALLAILLAVILLGYIRAGHDLSRNPFPYDLFLIAIGIALLPPRPEVWSGRKWLRYVIPLLFSVALFVNATYVAKKFAQAPTAGWLQLLGMGESAFFFVTYAWILIVPSAVSPGAKLAKLTKAFRLIYCAAGLFLIFEAVRFFLAANELNVLDRWPVPMRSFRHMALVLVLLSLVKRFLPLFLLRIYAMPEGPSQPDHVDQNASPPGVA